jgi:DNA-binding transcriptional ArsR family regulator
MGVVRAKHDRGPGQVSRRLNEVKGASVLLKTASDPTRVNLLLTLVEGEHDVSDLCDLIGQPQPKISHHLALLRQASLIQSHRQGKKNLYSLTDQGQEIARLLWMITHRLTDDTGSSSTLAIDPVLLEQVSGFVEDPEAWFRTPNAAFEGRMPVDLLGTDDEPRLRSRLEAAKLGMFS